LSGAIDLARDAVCHVELDELGFGEVVEPVNALGIAVPHKSLSISSDPAIGTTIEG
jgi:hypothetical protein